MNGIKRIKILRIQSRICIGGPAIHTEILSRYLPQQRYETLVIGGELEQKESSRLRELETKGVRIQIIKSMKRDLFSLHDIKTIIKLYKVIKTEQPDIVETHTAKAGGTGIIAARLSGVPIILHTFHGHVFEHYFNRAKTKLIILIEKFLAKLSTKIIVLSQQQYEDIVQRFRIASSKKTLIIPLGFELERFSCIKKNGSLKLELGISESDFLIAIIGRVVPIKNHEMMFRVIRQLNQEKIKVHLAIIGDGELREKLEKQVCDNYFHFLGWRYDLENIYSSVDLVALTSLNEGTPLALIEAMAAGVPVVATNVGGVSDIITNGETGFCCKINDDHDMTEKIKVLLFNKELSYQISQNARQFVLDRYNVQRLIDDMNNLYKNLIRSKLGCERYMIDCDKVKKLGADHDSTT